MPSRASVHVTVSNRQLVKENEARAKDLEQQLAVAEASKQTSDKINPLRVQICELLADLILTDPEYAVHKHVPDRLWRKCFYSRISRLRSKLAKEQRRQQQQLTTTTTDTAATTKATNASLEQHLVLFLTEAITLYKYLVDKLCDKLVEVVSSDNNKKDADEDDDENHVAIVECLHRLYICVGDLYRYHSSTHGPTRDAEASYLLASQLAPGMGHPANQLGVLCGAKILLANSMTNATATSTATTKAQSTSNQSAVGLYWYARSLMASKEPFETTSVNMNRLFHANQEWLDHYHHSQQQEQQHDAESTTAPHLQMSKSLQASLFLAQFVSLHGYLIMTEEETTASTKTTDVTTIKRNPDSFITSTLFTSVMQGLTTLLKQSALSDSLLVKLVTIQAFSECYSASREISSTTTKPSTGGIPASVSLVMGASSVNNNNHQLHHDSRIGPTKTIRQLLARITTLTIGIHVAERIITSHQQKSMAATTTSSTLPPTSSSVRLLLPLLLTTEYVWHSAADYFYHHQDLDVAASPSSEMSACYRYINSLSQDFWDKIVDVLNFLVPFAPPPTTTTTNDTTNQAWLPKEYLALRGFTPFASFITQETDNGFVSPKDALETLTEDKKLDASTTQDTMSATGGTGGAGSNVTKSHVSTVSGTQDLNNRTQEVNRLRLVSRFLALGQELVDDTTTPSLKGFNRTHDGLFVFDRDADDEKPEPMMDDDDDGGDDLNMFHEDDTMAVETTTNKDDDHDTGRGLLAYKESKAGGPALLMPGALLQQEPAPAATAAADIASEVTTGVDLGLLLGNAQNTPTFAQNVHPSITAVPMDVARDIDSHFSKSSVPSFSPLTGMDPHQLAALAESAATAPSALEAPVAPVMPPPGFGAPRASELDATSLLFGGSSSMRTSHGFAYSMEPQPPLSILESSGRLFGDPSMMQTANPFVPASSAYSLAPQPLPPPSNAFPQQPSDALWMMRDVFGSDDYDGTSLLDSGLLNSLLNDESSPQKNSSTTKNPFAA